MTAAVPALITAVVGVLGTLFAPVLSQRLMARQRAEEGRHAEARLGAMRRLMREDLGVER